MYVAHEKQNLGKHVNKQGMIIGYIRTSNSRQYRERPKEKQSTCQSYGNTQRSTNNNTDQTCKREVCKTVHVAQTDSGN